jgi:hypothetical protein
MCIIYSASVLFSKYMITPSNNATVSSADALCGIGTMMISKSADRVNGVADRLHN